MQTDFFWGRDKEINNLRGWNGHQSRLTVIYGRRRVGKTSLVERACRGAIMLQAEGLEGESQRAQQTLFLERVAESCGRPELTSFVPSSWRQLLTLASKEIGETPCVIFLDEFQWLAGGRTTLVSHLKYVWDNYLSRQNRVHLVLCGSVSSFMVDKVLRSKALYGRVDREIHLQPLRLPDIERDFTAKRSPAEVAELYMALGGIPQYLRLVDLSKSVRLNLQDLYFTPNGFLVNEFGRLFASHFGTNRHYRDILMALAEHRWADRDTLRQLCGVDSGGRMSEYLRNLETAGFVEGYAPVDRPHAQRGLRFRIADPYLLFYFRFVHRRRKQINARSHSTGMSAFVSDRAYAAWRGLAFEYLCYVHRFEIAQALGFGAVRYAAGSWFAKGATHRKAQIDLLFLRADEVITLCEIKFLEKNVDIGVTAEVQRKLEALPNPKQKTIERVLITASRPTPALANEGYFHRILTLEQLFATMRHQ